MARLEAAIEAWRRRDTYHYDLVVGYANRHHVELSRAKLNDAHREVISAALQLSATEIARVLRHSEQVWVTSGMFDPQPYYR